MDSISKIIVEINGKPLEDFENISINQNMYGIDSFEIACRFESLEKRDEFLIEKSKDYLGLPIVIQTKSKLNDNEEDCLFFKGFITEIQGRRSGMADNDQILISGGSEEILLHRKPFCRAFIDKNLDDIVKEVLRPYPLKSKIKSRTSQKFSYMVQFEESDLDFLKRLSIRYGEWFFFNGRELIFGEIPESEQVLTLGYNLTEFNYELRSNPVKFKMLAVEPMQNKKHEQKSGSGNVDKNLNIYGKHAFKQSKQLFPEEGKEFYGHLNVADSDYKNALQKVAEIDELAEAINLTDLHGTSTNGALIPGMQVMVNSPKEKGTEVTGYGRHLITSVQHYFDNLLSYNNSFTAIPAESTVPENTNPDFIQQSDTQVALVYDNRDPEKLGRIKVKFPWMEKDQTTPWIRIATPYVGIDWGFYFIPPKNAGVYCNFENGDIERPYCTGAFFDKQAKPDQAWVGNYREQDAKMQVIRTSSGNTIEFEDVSSSAGKIKIYTANNENYITLDNDNGALSIHTNGQLNLSGHKINMEAEEEIKIECNQKTGIVLTTDKLHQYSSGKVVVANDGDMSLEAINIKIAADASLNEEGTNVEIKANGALKAEGKGTTEVKSSGITIVKGSMVQIN